MGNKNLTPQEIVKETEKALKHIFSSIIPEHFKMYDVDFDITIKNSSHGNIRLLKDGETYDMSEDIR